MDFSCRLTAPRHSSRNVRGVARPSRKVADTRAKESGSGWPRRTEMLVEELERPVPGLGGGGRILLQADRVDDRIVAGEGMPRVVAMEGVLGARGFQLLFELIDLLDLEEAVVNGEVAHQGGLDLRCVDEFERREPVQRDRGVDLGHEDRREYRKGAAHAVAVDADLRARLFEILHRTANVLAGGVAEVQAGHQVLGLLGVEADLAAIEIRDEHAEPVLVPDLYRGKRSEEHTSELQSHVNL